MGRAVSANGILTRAYASARGVSLRTATNHRRRQTPEWLTFVHARAASEPLAPAPAPRHDVTQARDAVTAAHAVLEQLQRHARVCGSDLLPGVAHGMREAQRAWREAQEYATSVEKSAGELIPVDSLREFQRVFVSSLGEAMQALQRSVASRLPVAQRAAFYNAWKSARHDWDRRLRAADAQLESLLAPCSNPSS